MNEKTRLSTQAELKVQGCTNLKLRQLMRRVAHHYDLEMAKVGLKTTQYSLLTYVLGLGPMAMCCSSPSTTWWFRAGLLNWAGEARERCCA